MNEVNFKVEKTRTLFDVSQEISGVKCLEYTISLVCNTSDKTSELLFVSVFGAYKNKDFHFGFSTTSILYCDVVEKCSKIAKELIKFL